MAKKLDPSFFLRDVLDVAPELLGCYIIRVFPGNIQKRYRIKEVEAYRGEEDLACHASKGRTKRTEVMYGRGGLVYVYLIYGMYWMLNIVCSVEGEPQAVLIRAVEKFDGPGKLSREMEIDGSYNNEDITRSDRIWIEEASDTGIRYSTAPRINVDYAGEVWSKKKWRYILKK